MKSPGHTRREEDPKLNIDADLIRHLDSFCRNSGALMLVMEYPGLLTLFSSGKRNWLNTMSTDSIAIFANLLHDFIDHHDGDPATTVIRGYIPSNNRSNSCSMFISMSFLYSPHHLLLSVTPVFDTEVSSDMIISTDGCNWHLDRESGQWAAEQEIELSDTDIELLDMLKGDIRCVDMARVSKITPAGAKSRFKRLRLKLHLKSNSEIRPFARLRGWI